MTRRDRESLILGEAAIPRYGWMVAGICPICAWSMHRFLEDQIDEPRPCGQCSYAATPDEVAQWLAERGER